LRFDFYLPDYNTLIEFQGIHHYKPINKYRKAKIVHEKTIKHDEIKRSFCNENNIRLLEINYKDKEKISDILGVLL